MSRMLTEVQSLLDFLPHRQPADGTPLDPELQREVRALWGLHLARRILPGTQLHNILALLFHVLNPPMHA
jgi:hypothetical protein